MLAYYWNVMWLDEMVLLPVILYGPNQDPANIQQT